MYMYMCVCYMCVTYVIYMSYVHHIYVSCVCHIYVSCMYGTGWDYMIPIELPGWITHKRENRYGLEQWFSNHWWRGSRLIFNPFWTNKWSYRPDSSTTHAISNSSCQFSCTQSYALSTHSLVDHVLDFWVMLNCLEVSKCLLLIPLLILLQTSNKQFLN